MTLLFVLACAGTKLRPITGVDPIDLPADHGPHPEAQTEWWHVHADLTTMETGEPLHVFAAFLVQRTRLDRAAGIPVSWAVNPFHLGLVALQSGDERWVSDRSNFPDVFAGGFRRSTGELDLRHGNWDIAVEGGAVVLSVRLEGQHVELILEPTAPPAQPGDDGLVELFESGTHRWVQLERMEARGKWTRAGQTAWLEGIGFYKHQWGRLYPEDLDGFDWISLDINDEHSLSIAWLRGQETRGLEGSLAWISGPDGTIPIPTESLRVQPVASWKSKRSGNVWTTGWSVSGAGIELEVHTLLEEQELWAFPAALFVGPAWARGDVLGHPVDGLAFVEEAGGRAVPLRRFLRSGAPME